MEPAVQLFFASTPQEICFGGCVRSKPNRGAARKPGQFVEGLWEGDVLELFLRAKGGKGYIELNVSYDGCWWGASFSNYRVREIVLDRLPVKVQKKIDEDSWSAMMTVRRADISIAEPIEAHIAGILGSTYFTTAGSPGGTPDFHSEANFTLLAS